MTFNMVTGDLASFLLPVWEESFTLRLKPFLTPMVYPKLQQQLVIMVES